MTGWRAGHPLGGATAIDEEPSEATLAVRMVSSLIVPSTVDHRAVMVGIKADHMDAVGDPTDGNPPAVLGLPLKDANGDVAALNHRPCQLVGFGRRASATGRAAYRRERRIADQSALSEGGRRYPRKRQTTAGPAGQVGRRSRILLIGIKGLRR